MRNIPRGMDIFWNTFDSSFKVGWVGSDKRRFPVHEKCSPVHDEWCTGISYVSLLITWNQCVFNASVGRITSSGEGMHLLQTNLTSLHLCSNTISHSRLQLFTLQGFCYSWHVSISCNAEHMFKYSGQYASICANFRYTYASYAAICANISHVINRKCCPGAFFWFIHIWKTSGWFRICSAPAGLIGLGILQTVGWLTSCS